LLQIFNCVERYKTLCNQILGLSFAPHTIVNTFSNNSSHVNVLQDEGRCSINILPSLSGISGVTVEIVDLQTTSVTLNQ